MLKHLAFFALLFAAAVAAPVDEIESLLGYIGGLHDAVFIRNGDEHTPTEAESHLRLKWSHQKDEIKTAEDFIRLCGTKSSMSGKPYTIRFADGHEEPAAEVLLKQLAKIRAPKASPPKTSDK
jgi:hypothetical protein